MRRLGLFTQIYLRAITLIVVSLGIMLVLAHLHEYRTMVRTRQADLTQEAAWIARHWQADVEPEILANAWSQTHDGVRLQIIDGAGVVIADSQRRGHLDNFQALHNATGIAGRAPILLETGEGELVLSRDAIRLFPIQSQFELMLAAVGLALLAGVLMFPLIRGLTRSFADLSTLAARVADGQFGETIPEEGARDIRAVISSFNEMSRRLKQAEIKNQRLLRDVSHELRSPLARFKALVDTAKRHPEELEHLAAQLNQEADLMNRLVGDVLLAARLDAPEPELDLKPTALGDWLTEASLRLGGIVEAAGATWRADIPEDPAMVSLDTQRMMQVLGNLTDNALHAVKAREDAEIALALVINDAAHIALSDNGKGIAAADLPYVFDRFYRVDEGRATADGGAGLGLSIVKAIADAHGGGIEIHSTPGTGTRIEITLPLLRSSA